MLPVLVGFSHVPAGFRNRTLASQVAEVLNEPYSSRQAAYDLRRLRRKGLILKVPRSQRYEVTSLGRRIAVLFTKTHGRVLAPGLGVLDPKPPEELGARSPSPWLGGVSKTPWMTSSSGNSALRKLDQYGELHRYQAI